MYAPSRRIVMFGGVSLFIVGCTTPQSQTSFEMTKAYSNDLANALSASADVFLASTNPTPTAAQLSLVLHAKTSIQQAKDIINSTTAPSDARTAVQTVITDVGLMAPLLGPLLGPAALYIPLAVAVLQAFIDSLPPPPNAPPMPPAALHEKAMAYHRGH